MTDQQLTGSGLTAAEIARFEEEAARLLAFGRGSRHEGGGFGWLDDHGRITPERPVETWITCRMTHVFGLAQLRGEEWASAYVSHGVGALTGLLHDADNGGWHSAVSPETGEVVSTVKEGYAHAFVVLAATTAYAAGHPGAEALLADALEVMETRFWREEDGLIVDVWSADWASLDGYRGVNANMHTVEAFLAVAEVTGRRVWLDRALRILERVVHGFAREHDWRLPEHFSSSWSVELDYNIDEPGHPFRPYGVTIGHLFEWARLALHARTLLGSEAPSWLLEDARSLLAAASARGWAVDGAPGFVYTTDFADEPVVRERMHWVAAEAVAAAWTLFRDTGSADALADVRRWWAYCEEHLVDREGGSWHHELDPANRPSATVWQGKPDVYHAYQMAILPLLPAGGSFAGAAGGGGSTSGRTA
ncbi:AGE family epimerase/isomerase [Nocardioides luteus]|uniref:AGE family epimerase/isomerase n=1 Tax=Nocardioides luteus TaxID=1844 RepID=UPI000A83F007|nr:AGE family epimerase/isomerase [Nocardioides luteus]